MQKTSLKMQVREQLFRMQDIEYRDFHSKLMPTIDPELIIGIRTPELRKFAKEMARQEGWKEYLTELPHKYYEENNLHGFLLESIKDYDECIDELEKFLPYIDNWATCDMMAPKVFGKHTKELLEKIKLWICSDKTYTVRFGLGMLMRFYLDDAFEEEYLELAASVRSEEYYINMMIAWFFATALAKQWEAAIPWIEKGCLPVWVHNKSIQKAVESRRITPEQKEYLKTFRIKK